MFNHSRALAAGLMSAVLTLSGGAAWADTVYNNLDGSIDSAYEHMFLTYDTATSTGSSGTTTLAIRVDDRPDHPGCNIQGGSHYIQLAATSSNTTVATVALNQGGVFDACTDTVLATVQATGVGTSDITFAMVASDVSNDPHLTFDLAPASFDVTVSDRTTPVATGCDVDPAAPAWAAAMLKASGVKPGSKAWTNYIATIAQEMGPRATYAGFEKDAHPAYENAVHARLGILTGKWIASAQDAARPGWECAPLS